MAISNVMSKSLISAGNAVKMAEIRRGLNNELRSAAKEDLEEKRAEKKRTEKAAEKKKTEKADQERKETDLNEGAGEMGSVNIAADGITPETGVVETVGTKVDVKA